MNGVEDSVLDYIVDKAVEFNLGARGIRTICETIMIDTMFDAPSKNKKHITINLGFAKEKIEKANLAR